MNTDATSTVDHQHARHARRDHTSATRSAAGRQAPTSISPRSSSIDGTAAH